MLQQVLQAGKTATTDSGSSEVLKALIGSVVGLLVGLVASPLTLWAKAWLDRRSAKTAIYSDLGRMYHVLNRVLDIYPEPVTAKTDEARANQRRAMDLLKNNISDSVFQYYSTAGAAVFWGLTEAVAVKKLYQVTMATGQSLTVDKWPETHASIEAAFRQFNEFFDEGRIDEAKLLNYRAQHRTRTADAVIRFHSVTKGPLIRDSQGSPRTKYTQDA